MRAWLVFLAACTPVSSGPSTPVGQPPLGSDSVPKPPDEPKFELSMQRTPCMGRCPTYKLEIHDDNSVVYTGQQNVSVVGEQKGTITADGRAKIIAKIEALQLFDYDQTGHLKQEPKCRSNGDGTQTCEMTMGGMCSDTPHANFVVSLGEKKVTTTNLHCSENPLDELETLLAEVADTKRWTGR